VVSSDEKIKKKFEELEESMKKHMAVAKQADKERMEKLEARVKSLEEKMKKK